MTLLFKNPQKQTEEELKSILSDSYKSVENVFISSKKGKKQHNNNCQEVISATEVGIERICLKLLDRDVISSPQKLRDALCSAKGTIVNAQIIKAKTKDICPNERLEKLINFLIKLTCEQEAAMAIEKIGWKRVAKTDSKEAFKGVKKEALAQQFAYQILRGEIPKSKEKVTIFVDEAVDDYIYNAGENAKKVGNGGYIICKGSLGSEKQITAKNTIRRAAFSFGETNRIEKITEEVIRKALAYLAEELKFRGEVRVFSDNLAAVRLWQNNQFNKAIAEYFASFTIKHIPREKNKAADKLVRDNKVVPVPKGELRAIVGKAERTETLEAEIEKLRAAQNEKPKGYFGRILKMLPRSA